MIRLLIPCILSFLLLGCTSSEQTQQMGKDASHTMTHTMGDTFISIGRGAAFSAGQSLRH